MTDEKYIGLDVHQATISVAVNAADGAGASPAGGKRDLRDISPKVTGIRILA